jgi:hypothetical protein
MGEALRAAIGRLLFFGEPVAPISSASIHQSVSGLISTRFEMSPATLRLRFVHSAKTSESEH